MQNGGYNLYCLTSYSGPTQVDTSSKKNAMTLVLIMQLIRRAVHFVAGINVTF